MSTTARRNRSTSPTTARATAATTTGPVPTTPPTAGAARYSRIANGAASGKFSAGILPAQAETAAAFSDSTPVGIWAATAGLVASGSGSGTTVGTGSHGIASSSNASSSAKPKSKFPVVPVVAGAAGGLVALILVIIGVVCCVRRRRRQRKSFNQRTTNLRNSYISTPNYGENSPALYALRDTYSTAPQPMPMPHSPAPDYYHATYDARSDFSYDKPNRFAGSAQDRGYGMR